MKKKRPPALAHYFMGPGNEDLVLTIRRKGDCYAVGIGKPADEATEGAFTVHTVWNQGRAKGENFVASLVDIFKWMDWYHVEGPAAVLKQGLPKHYHRWIDKADVRFLSIKFLELIEAKGRS